MSSRFWNWLAKSSVHNLFFLFSNKNWRDERQKNVYSYRPFNPHCSLLSLPFLQNLWVVCLLWRSTLTSWIWQSWLTCLTRNWLRFLLILMRRPTASRPQVTLGWLTNKLPDCLTVREFSQKLCKCGKTNARRKFVKVVKIWFLYFFQSFLNVTE